MKVLNYKFEDEFFQDLDVVKQHLEESSRVRISQKAALVSLVWQAANVVRNTGKLWEWEGSPDRNA